jgi:hypothetical protein
VTGTGSDRGEARIARRPRRSGSAALSRLALAVGLAIGSGLATACGVPTEDRAHLIGAADLPYGLADRGTDAAPEAGADNLDGLEPVTLYFPVGSGLVAVTRSLPAPASLADVVAALARSGDAPAAPTRSAVGRGDVERVDIRAGLATVELDRRIVDLPTAELRVAVAQLVLTLTDRPGVGQVAFTVGDDPVQVPRADGTLARSTVSRDDFVILVVS